MIEELAALKTPYLKTDYLLSLFSSYKAPRDKIKNLLKKGDLIAIRQGLYVLGKVYQHPYSREVLAGMIYGPSAISFESALAYFGFIPEQVKNIQSICFKRDKLFHTPLGDFSYKYISATHFSIGLEYIQSDIGNFLIASPEKALCDLVYFQKFENEMILVEYILSDLRIDSDEICKLRINLLLEIERAYARKSVQHLLNAVILIQKREASGASSY